MQVEVSITARKPGPQQIHAWTRIWRLLLAPEQTNAPEVLAPRASDGGTVASRTREDLNGYRQHTPDC
jgi:hypothetical protein